jgi:hypothetical protein
MYIYKEHQYRREERWVFKYTYTVNGKREVHYCYPTTKQSIEHNRKYCEERGWEVVYVKKVYPFSTEKNQHNFDLISNVCSNRMHDMDMGDIPMDKEAYDKMYELRKKAQRYFGLPLPVAWLTWDDLKEAKEIVAMAHEHRYAANLEAGNLDWLHLC